jgi:hypothetical protein
MTNRTVSCMRREASYRKVNGEARRRGTELVMSKRKDKRSDIVLETKPKRFGIVPEFFLIENRLFRFGPESALLDHIERISFDNTNSWKNSVVFCFIPFRYWSVCGTIVERLLLYCSDITKQKE